MDKTPLLLIDADDTIWESALYFRRAEEDFVSLMGSLGHDADAVRDTVHSRDIQRLSSTGYGAEPYLDTLEAVMEEMSPSPPAWACDCMEAIRSTLLGHPVILLPGVESTIASLASEGRTTFVYTMGREGHQLDKFRRSGLSRTVDGVRVLPVKTAEALMTLIEDLAADPARTAVIGNSPRSDIRPALAAGVNAVYVHRPGTWVAEHAELPESDRLMEVTSFGRVPWALGRLGLMGGKD
jgi:putative hydrolase of the HAD superfamily